MQEKQKSPRLIEIGKQLGRANLEEKGIAYFKENGRKSVESRNSKFQTPEEKKAYYSAMGKKSVAIRRAKKAAFLEQLAKHKEESRDVTSNEKHYSRNPIHIINSFFTGKDE